MSLNSWLLIQYSPLWLPVLLTVLEEENMFWMLARSWFHLTLMWCNPCSAWQFITDLQPEYELQV